MEFSDAVSLLKEKDVISFVERGQRSMYYVYWADGGYGQMNKDALITLAKDYN